MRFPRIAICLVVMLCALTADGRVTRLVIEEKQSPAYSGKTFGKAGMYERLAGRVEGELDPSDPLNALITDLERAPRNARGMVEYSATFAIHKPVEMSKASGVLIYDVANRGNQLLFYAFHRGGDPGDGFLFDRGHVILTSGWQGDVLPGPKMQSLVVPIARNSDGTSITGPVLARFADLPVGTRSVSLAGTTPRRVYSAARLDTASATLTRRASEDGAIVPIASTEWAFADCTARPFPGVPDPGKLCLKNGFDPALLYELVYTAKDPLVLGIGLAATRDIASFFRYEQKDGWGTLNPIAGAISHTVAQGISQAGNLVKTFIHLGFNEDERHRMVWDGANDHIAGRQVPLNLRFGVPGGAANLYEPGSEPVLWWSEYEDAVRGLEAGGMLRRCRASKTCPKIFETFGSAEFWGLRMSPGLVGTKADRDIPLPPEVRRYYFPGTTHGGGRGGFSLDAPAAIRCELPDNPNPQSDTMRALLDALVAWVVRGVAPPPSEYPRQDRHQLVPPDHIAMGFPPIAGRPMPDNMLNPVYQYDFGPGFRYRDLSGVMAMQPPKIVRTIPSLVPLVNEDGNETAGVPSVLLQAPLGTYLGWNVAASGFQKGRACGFSGGFIPFARTKVERLTSGDPRQSIEERYSGAAGYMARVRRAADQAVAGRFLLREDADRLVKEAESASAKLFNQ